MFLKIIPLLNVFFLVFSLKKNILETVVYILKKKNYILEFLFLINQFKGRVLELKV